MFILAIVGIILLLILASSGLFVEQFSQEELSNMGVQEQ
jgi:hypothetical protein